MAIRAALLAMLAASVGCGARLVDDDDPLILADASESDDSDDGTHSPVETYDGEPTGACGECLTDADCPGGTCVAGQLIYETGVFTGSTCQ